jgi:hypothetical protein
LELAEMSGDVHPRHLLRSGHFGAEITAANRGNGGKVHPPSEEHGAVALRHRVLLAVATAVPLVLAASGPVSPDELRQAGGRLANNVRPGTWS